MEILIVRQSNPKFAVLPAKQAIGDGKSHKLWLAIRWFSVAREIYKGGWSWQKRGLMVQGYI